MNDEQRAMFPGMRQSDGRYDAVESDQALETLVEWQRACGENQIAAIGSPRASLETNYLLRRLVGPQNYCGGSSDHEALLVNEIACILRDGPVSTPSMRKVESADAVLILGEDVTNTAPRLALSLRQSVRNRAKQMAGAMKIPLVARRSGCGCWHRIHSARYLLLLRRTRDWMM